MSINFMLNDTEVLVDCESAGKSLLDYIRDTAALKGTKEGCREGDCGACTVLVGELNGQTVRYKAVCSCLFPLGDVCGKHIVTIEGLNQEDLSPIQQEIIGEGASQCGYCTPGIILAFTGFLLQSPVINEEEALIALTGNICRCTGYASIKKAVQTLIHDCPIAEVDVLERIDVLVEQGYLPEYFLTVGHRLLQMKIPDEMPHPDYGQFVMAGGTDLFVQIPERLQKSSIYFYHGHRKEKIWKEQNYVYLGAHANIEDLKSSRILVRLIPRLPQFINLICAPPIRNRATIAGNIVNASPIGDSTIMLLALNAELFLNDGLRERIVPLRDFYHGYKRLELHENELIAWLRVPIPEGELSFNFEKVCKRKYLDIASVNSALAVSVSGDLLTEVSISAGGVAPIPLYLKKTSDFMVGKRLSLELIHDAMYLVDDEISPISDVRGSSEYKRHLLKHLIFAHFQVLFGIEGELP